MGWLDRRRHLGVLILILVLAGTLRLVGIEWGGANSLHPDERFLAMVATSMGPNDRVLDYFDTPNSTLNPENVGSKPAFVYGTYPLILVRLLGEAVGWTGMGELRTMGRLVSTGWDLLTILMVYLLGVRLADRRAGLLAAFFLAVTVLHIQQSHYFTVDLAQTFFVTLALYIAVGIGRAPASADDGVVSGMRVRLTAARLGPSLAFGAVAAAAVAAKLSAAPVVLLLPAAQLLRVLLVDRDERSGEVLPTIVALTVSGLIFGLSFRILQPYAFAGPGFFDLGLNPRWTAAIDNLRSLTGPGADWPPAMQWARRSFFYSGDNLVRWGFGLPLGLLAFAGAAAAARRVLRRGAGPLVLVVGWTVGYFTWQSMQGNPTMRYQLPIYPALAFLAAWVVMAAARSGADGERSSRRRTTAAVVGGGVAAATLIYAVAFTGIYTRPVTREAASRWMLEQIPGPINLHLDTDDGPKRQPVPFPYDTRLIPGRSSQTRTRAVIAGRAHTMDLPRVRLGADDRASAFPIEPPRLSAVIRVEGGAETTATTTCTPTDPPLFSCNLELEERLEIAAGDSLTITLDLVAGPSVWATLEGAAIANETPWDDGLPLRIDGYDPYSGIYQRDLNLELYWNDDTAKRNRMLEILDASDVLAISSNRQWGTLPRIPERFPLVTTYYRHLIGCPPDRSVASCFIDAEPGRVHGDLGFELEATFTSPPRLGPLIINDQSADEAFTVYDHPKVLVFRKTDAYDSTHVRQVLESVDLNRVLLKPPGHFGRQPADLMLPAHRVERQQQKGTWRERFPPDSLFNRHPATAAVAWYLALAVIGFGLAPIVRWALPGLADRGLPLARGVALLLLAWLVWITGSVGVEVGPGTVRWVAVALVAAGALFAWRFRGEGAETRAELVRRVLTTEAVFAVFFLISLWVRVLNPDLWHAGYGGEKPMDLSYFTAVLKSINFPPYDPWFAGGYVNYYYFGFVIVGQLALGLGIEPAIAYNLAIPTLMALAASAAYSVAANAVRSGDHPGDGAQDRGPRPELAGLAAATGIVLMGNLHPVRMFFAGLIELGGGAAEGVASALAAGIGRLAAGQPLPIPGHHWFWNPTRVIPDPDGSPITEFPAFTLVYGDLHAHLMDLPQVLLAMAFALAVLVGWTEPGNRFRRGATLFIGALAVGAMGPTNTWSYYPFLALCCIAIAWARIQIEDDLPPRVVLFRASLWAAAFVALTKVLYLPFDAWFGMGYSELQYWSASRTPLLIYLELWAPFLFPVATWLVLELRDWLAATPLEAIRPLRNHLWTMIAVAGPAAAGQAVLLDLGVRISWLAWPMMVIAALLLMRRDLSHGRRFTLLAVGLGLSLTVVVELVTLKYDLGRMNTVFKFYYVSWILLAVSAAVSLWWIAARRPRGPRWIRRWWWLTAGALLAGALVFPLKAIPAKAAERMTHEAPRGLDGLAYLEHAIHHDQGRPLVLAEDLAAIRWLQRNVDGTPVIVEANIPEYRWGSRITINTGLPGVVGWNWHQRQQRAFATDRWVWDRVRAIELFYTTSDREEVKSFLDRFNVEWIIVGQLERAYYPAEGLSKFSDWEGDLWHEVFHQGETSIYRVGPRPS
jgi:YYY domain-containing protein